MKLWKAIGLAVGYVALQWALVAIGAPANEYAIWAGTGITCVLMMLMGAAFSLCILAVAVLNQNMRIAVPGLILAVGCTLPLYLIMGVGLLLGL